MAWGYAAATTAIGVALDLFLLGTRLCKFVPHGGFALTLPPGHVQGYTKHYPCSGEELLSALASSLSQQRSTQPAAERPSYTSPSTLKSSSTMRSTSDTTGTTLYKMASHSSSAARRLSHGHALIQHAQ